MMRTDDEIIKMAIHWTKEFLKINIKSLRISLKEEEVDPNIRGLFWDRLKEYSQDLKDIESLDIENLDL